ncbi:MAG: sigma-54 dependent transcriptional regulator [Planctomycetia bacterium]|nr:sigma-54 dependent transcriptional regulator [Planctomycetia bacterium]
MSESPLEVLVIDDELGHADAVAVSLERIGAHSTVVHSQKEAFLKIASEEYDVVVTDLMLERPDGGLMILKKVKEESPETEVIVMTAFTGIEMAVEAMRQGAFNYLQKPLDLKQLRTIVLKAAESVTLRRANRELKERLDEKFGFNGVVGNSPEMVQLIERLKRIAPTDATVLVLGDTGTGKELIAQAIHQNSMRKNKPFVALNCAALSENILESELFGHVKGAFTGAISDRVGKFEYAAGGTLFLDEVGDMPMATQIKLLRVLENGEITRVGSNTAIKVNVRIVSATNRPLEEAVQDGSFRMDLYHRLKVLTVRLPSLADRASDIPILLDHFIKQFSKSYGKTITRVDKSVRRKLYFYKWPGNVRQLKNVVESMVVVDVDGVLGEDDLPDELIAALPGQEESGTSVPSEQESVSFVEDRAKDCDASTSEAVSAPSAPVAANSLRSLIGHSLEEIETAFIKETLLATGGNREEAARLLGIGERTLYRKIAGK